MIFIMCNNVNFRKVCITTFEPFQYKYAFTYEVGF